MKIKSFNVVLTLAAFSALFFFLPADKNTSNPAENKPQAHSSQLNVHQKISKPHSTVRGHVLHST